MRQEGESRKLISTSRVEEPKNNYAKSLRYCAKLYTGYKIFCIL